MQLGPDTIIADGSENCKHRWNSFLRRKLFNVYLKVAAHDGNNLTGSITDINRNFSRTFTSHVYWKSQNNMK